VLFLSYTILRGILQLNVLWLLCTLETQLALSIHVEELGSYKAKVLHQGAAVRGISPDVCFPS
jgi:hypothetical protein